MVHVSPGTVAIKSIGCRTNQEEMVTLRFQLEKTGTRVIEDPAEADVIIVNTCAVTANTESKTRRLIAALAKQSPKARILVTGCLAQKQPEELSHASNVSWVVGNLYKHDIAALLNDRAGVFHSDFPKTGTAELHCTGDITGSSSRTRFPLKIQEGCDFACAYCIVPRLRGPSRSAAYKEVVDNCTLAVNAGYKEIVLAGTHIGQYDGGIRLPELLSRLTSIEGEFRVRLSSLDPRDLDQPLLEVIASNSRICKHLHISLQSLSPDVLKLMDRPYDDFDKLMETLHSLRRMMPDIGMGADLIAGFPGESDGMFRETLQNLKSLDLSYGHIFRYSQRPGTRAQDMADQVPEGVKQERSNSIRQVLAHSREQFIKRCTSPQKIIVESGSPVRGITSNYLHVIIPEFFAPKNTWLDVTIVGKIDDRNCMANPITKEVL